MADGYTTFEGGPLSVSAPGVLDNDFDPDGGPLTVSLVSGVSDGTLTLNEDGSFSYTPDAEFTGTDRFDYRAVDESGNADTASVEITVEVNQPPVAQADSFGTLENQTLSVSAPGMLDNDSDPEGSSLTASLVSGVSDGTLTLNEDGSFSYTPNAGFAGTDRFDYRAADEAGNADTASVEITVEAIPTVYVDRDATGAADGSSWADAYPNLQDALANAPSGPVQVWVADGTYQPDVGQSVTSGDRTASFTIRDSLSIYGGFDGTDGSGGGTRETEITQRDPTPDSTGTVLTGDQGDEGFRGDDAFHVVTVDGGSAVLDGIVVRDGLASGSDPNHSGAGIWVKSGDLTVRNALIANNAASGSGGNGGGVLGGGTFEDVTFRNNTADGSGGGMNGDGTFTEVTFRDNSAGGSGGGLNGGGTLTDVTFRNNTAGNSGGGMNGSGTFTDVTFDNNTANSGRGGGLFLEEFGRGSVDFEQVTFTENTSEESGGGASIRGGSMTVRAANVTFDNNDSGRGGGLFLEEFEGGSVHLEQVTFTGNTAEGSGGGVYTRGATVNAVNVTFQDNAGAFGSGGGLWADRSVDLQQVTFTENTAGEDGGGAFTGGAVRAVDVSFKNNTSSSGAGGGVRVGGSADLKRVTFTGNTADQSGGGAFTEFTVRAVNVRFLGNQSTGSNAGGLYIQNSGEPIANAVFSGNDASGAAGALYIGGDSSPTLSNMTFTNNTADGNGGALYTTGTNTFPTIVNSIFWGNSASNGPEMYVNSGQPSVGHSIVEGGLPGGAFDDGTVLDQDPVFVAPLGPDSTAGTADDSLAVQAGSPAIDAGDDSALPSDTLDINDNDNTSETLPLDLAGNARQQDVPGVSPDGDFAVDLGAYEASGDLQNELALGDVDGSGDVTPNDASMTLRAFLDLVSLSPAEERAADFNEDNRVTPYDASLILQDYLGTDAGAALAKAGSKTQGTIRLGDMQVENGTATIPVRLTDDAQRVQSVALDLSLDASAASVASITPSVPDGWMTEKNVTDDGTLRIGLAGASAATGGQIATIRLSLSGDAADAVTEGHFRLNGSEKQALGTEIAPTPSEFAMDANYPNPVRQSTTIEYALPEAASVTLRVYDVLGRRVRTLVNERKEAGRHSVTWGGQSDGGGSVASGVYFYRIEAGDHTATRKMTVVR